MLRNKKVRRVLIILMIITIIATLIAIRPSMADADYTYSATNGGQVELDGENDGEVTVEFKVAEAGRYYIFGGDLSMHETTVAGASASTSHFTLTSNEIVSMPDSMSEYQDDEVISATSCVRFYYEDTNDDGSTGLDLAAGGTIWKATYSVDSTTPSGTYYVALSNAFVTYLDTNEADQEWDASTDNTVLVATIQVTRAKVNVTPAVSGYEENYQYTGSQIKPEVTVTSSTNPSLVLEKDRDYTVTYGENKEIAENGGSITIHPVESSDYNVAETTVSFNITKATSNIAVLNATIAQAFPNGIRVPAGIPLASLETLLATQNPLLSLSAFGVSWKNPMTVISTGSHSYDITYVQNGDATHYNASDEVVTIYGLDKVAVDISVDGENGTFSVPSKELTNKTETIVSDVLEDTEITIELNPDEDYAVNKVTVDGVEQEVVDNKVIVTATDEDMVVVVTFKYALLPLTISGIENNQEIPYTGQPVELEGNLAVSENADEITVNDLTTTWYDSDDNIISQPSEIGTYKVVYSYKGDNYEGSLTVNFEIIKAQSDFNALLTQLGSFGEIKVPVGTKLSEIEGIIKAQYPIFSMAAFGLSWEDDTTVVSAGAGAYPVNYLQKNDSTHYNSVNGMIPIYGLNIVTIATSVDGGHGTITEVEEPVLEGTEVTITVTPDDGYRISKVTVDDEEVTVSNNKIVVTAGNADTMEIVAKFELIPITYEYLEGEGQTYTIGTDGTATFRIDAAYSLFDKVYVDDKLVDSSNYTSKSGSTVITLTKEFMESLSVGTHTLKVTFTDSGTAATTFTVKAAETVQDSVDNTVENTTADPTNTAVDNTVVAAKPTQSTSNTPKTGDKVLVDIYVAIVSGLGLFMIIDHKLNSKPRKSTRRRK